MLMCCPCRRRSSIALIGRLTTFPHVGGSFESLESVPVDEARSDLNGSLDYSLSGFMELTYRGRKVRTPKHLPYIMAIFITPSR